MRKPIKLKFFKCLYDLPRVKQVGYTNNIIHEIIFKHNKQNQITPSISYWKIADAGRGRGQNLEPPPAVYLNDPMVSWLKTVEKDPNCESVSVRKLS